MLPSRPSLAVVGHVEWVEFARVEHVPLTGEVVHALDSFEEPAGGGAVAAVQLARLAGGSVLFTALGEDEHGRASVHRLAELDVEVRAAIQAAPSRRALTLLDEAGERTITTFGARLEPTLEDREDRRRLSEIDATYFTAGDRGALEAARAGSRVLVASPRAHSRARRRRRARRARAQRRGRGGARGRRGRRGARRGRRLDRRRARRALSRALRRERSLGRRRRRPVRPSTPTAAATRSPRGSRSASGRGLGLRDALALAARCGAVCLTGRGPYERQLTAADL